MRNLEKVRNWWGYTKEDVADLTGLAPATISRYENGVNARRSNAERLADALCVPVRALTDPDPLEDLVY